LTIEHVRSALTAGGLAY